MYDGEIYNKVKDSKYTYIRYKPVKGFLMQVVESREVADVILPCINQLVNVLSDPDCRLIKSIRIDHNFIEVLPRGMCFDIERKKFRKDPKNLQGSPRAFVYYKYNGKVPEPKYFIEGTKLISIIIYVH